MVSIIPLKPNFFVTLENVFSNAGGINCGIPKNLRTAFLHNIYINDLPQALNETGSSLYANDTCIKILRRQKKF